MLRRHIIVLPGSGYQRHAPHEGDPVAEWLRTLGFEASVLWYPVRTRHPGPLQALQARIGHLRDQGVDWVAVLGFSAGGHLGGLAALAAHDDRMRLDAAVLGYPVVSMLTEHHAASRINLLGEAATADERTAVSLERLVTAAAPPFFLWHTAADASVPVEHSLLLAQALADGGVPYELHVYPHGQHGLGLAVDEPGARDWTAVCERWLTRLAG